MWTICSGRSLQFGPEWPESDARLAFDACSGDYWVLDALGRDVLRLLLDQRALSAAALQQQLGEVEKLATALDSLSEARLIEPMQRGIN